MLMRAATVVQVLQDLFYFYCMFYFTCDRSLRGTEGDTKEEKTWRKGIGFKPTTEDTIRQDPGFRIKI